MRRISRSHTRSGLLAAFAILVFSLATMLVSAPGAVAANAPGRPTLIVHGYDVYSLVTPGINCAEQLGALAGDMSTGLSRKVVTVGFYSGDTNCSMNLHDDARARGADYADRDSYKEVSKALSWYIFNTYTNRGIKVDLIGYSLGGVIVRGAVYGAQIREAGFSPPIDVGNAVTLGAPFNGANLGCLTGQCASFTQNSKDLRWLNQSCDAQGKNTTLWTIFGSTYDGVVPADSATQMCTWPDRKFVLDNVPHSGATSYVGARWVIQLVRQSIGGQTSRIYSGFTANRCLDVKLMSTANGTPVQTFDCNNTYAQFWTRQATGQQTQISALGKCLDRSANGTANGTLVQVWACNGSPAQQWTQYSDRTIRSAGTCLTATGNWANYAQFIVYTCNGGGGQLWS